MPEETTQSVPPVVAETKQFRKDLDAVLQNIRKSSDKNYKGERSPDHPVRSSRERSLVITKLQEAIMWLGMDLKAINEEVPGSAENPYPQSYNSLSPVIEKTADGLKL